MWLRSVGAANMKSVIKDILRVRIFTCNFNLFCIRCSFCSLSFAAAETAAFFCYNLLLVLFVLACCCLCLPNAYGNDGLYFHYTLFLLLSFFIYLCRIFYFIFSSIDLENSQYLKVKNIQQFTYYLVKPY